MKIKTAQFIRSVQRMEQLPRDGLPEIAFAGRSNVGKSSLINTLLGRKNLARISSTPGKTRQLNYYCINEALYLVDLPGYGYARVPHAEKWLWADLLEPYIETRGELRAVVHVLDARHPPTESDLQMVQWLAFHHRPFVLAMTKTDKLSENALAMHVERDRKILSPFGSPPIVLCSAKTGRGRHELWKALNGKLSAIRDPSGGWALTADSI